MWKVRLNQLLLLVVSVLLLGQWTTARTRYNEYVYKPCAIGASNANPSCRNYCQQEDFSYGGCDCVTKMCVCADMALDFCNFQEIRKFI